MRGQLDLQEPGPRGSPHVPQEPAGSRAAARLEPVLTAKVDSCLVSRLPPHRGQAGLRSAVTSCSKR